MIKPEVYQKKNKKTAGDDGKKTAVCAYHDCDAAASTRLFEGGVSARTCETHVGLLLLRRSGTCCSCGYSGPEETECPTRADRAHCAHWWDGTDGDSRWSSARKKESHEEQDEEES
jgi:hypothetical protein